jgi:hypothetical protein
VEQSDSFCQKNRNRKKSFATPKKKCIAAEKNCEVAFEIRQPFVLSVVIAFDKFNRMFVIIYFRS